jgi:hypothetical protein
MAVLVLKIKSGCSKAAGHGREQWPNADVLVGAMLTTHLVLIC